MKKIFQRSKLQIRLIRAILNRDFIWRLIINLYKCKNKILLELINNEIKTKNGEFFYFGNFGIMFSVKQYMVYA